jgi:hypothetical protein
MSGVVKGDLSNAEERFASLAGPVVLSPERDRGRGHGRYLRASNPTLDIDQHLAKMHEYLSINHYAFNVDNQDDDGYDSDADLEPVIGPEDPDWMDIDNHEHVRKVDDKYIFDMDAQIELTPEEQAQGESLDDMHGVTFPLYRRFAYRLTYTSHIGTQNQLFETAASFDKTSHPAKRDHTKTPTNTNGISGMSQTLTTKCYVFHPNPNPTQCFLSVRTAQTSKILSKRLTIIRQSS